MSTTFHSVLWTRVRSTGPAPATQAPVRVRDAAAAATTTAGGGALRATVVADKSLYYTVQCTAYATAARSPLHRRRSVALRCSTAATHEARASAGEWICTRAQRCTGGGVRVSVTARGVGKLAAADPGLSPIVKQRRRQHRHRAADGVATGGPPMQRERRAGFSRKCVRANPPARPSVVRHACVCV